MTSSQIGPRAAAYRGRFAPSPTGPLHAGSLVAALGSFLDARAHGGRWLVRIEDLDPPREVPGAAEFILQQLDRLGMRPDGEVVWQSRRHGLYEAALSSLIAGGQAYPCTCSRRDVADALAAAGLVPTRHHSAVYPGTCRPTGSGLAAGSRRPDGRPAAWRLKVPPGDIRWDERAWPPDGQTSPRDETLSATTGDFILRRADGFWAYQLAVVVDDAEQGVTDVVRGADLASSTARQVWLQDCLGLPRPRHLHLPLVLDAHGDKLSKQTGAPAVDLERPLATLQHGLRFLGLGTLDAPTPEALLTLAATHWANRLRRTSTASVGSPDCAADVE